MSKITSLSRKAKNLVLVSATFAAPALLAQDSGGEDISGAITEVQNTMTGWISSLKAPLIAIVVAGLVIWFIPKLVRYFKSAFAGGTGK